MDKGKTKKEKKKEKRDQIKGAKVRCYEDDLPLKVESIKIKGSRKDTKRQVRSTVGTFLRFDSSGPPLFSSGPRVDTGRGEGTLVGESQEYQGGQT